MTPPARRRLPAAALALLLACPAPPAALADGLLTTRPAVLYGAPSDKGNPLLILDTGFPLRRVVRTDQWDKVETPDGKVGWVRSGETDTAHLAVVRAPRANVRERPAAAAEIVFAAEKGVVLEVRQDEADGWIAVRHEDGEAGYVRAQAVWKNHTRLPADPDEESQP